MAKTPRRKSGQKASSGRRRSSQPKWADLPDEELLQWRICDLDLKIDGTILEERIERLNQELEYRGLRFRPHFWLSDEWFSPDAVPGIAIPFYLAHPRLARLERKMMLEVEGGTEDWCLRILRHEAGHTLDSAYRLHRRQRWREMFGKFSDPYPDFYQPKPYSKSFVMHLDMWYAQSHPAEDFAETFAVWLKPRSRWRSQYHDWPALAKLEYVDELMHEIADSIPPVRSKRTVDSVREMRKTLGEHYTEKRARYMVGDPHVYDRELRRLFSDEPEHAQNPSAAAFLRKHRQELRQVVAHWTSQYQYIINQVLAEMIQRCRELNLRLDTTPRETKRDVMVMLTVVVMNYLHGGHHRLAL